MYTQAEMTKQWQEEDMKHLEYINKMIDEYKTKVNKYLFDPLLRNHMQEMLILLKKEKFQCEGEYRDDYGTDPVYSERLNRTTGG